MFAALPACTDAETYGTCAGGAGGRQYNLDMMLNVNRYADIEMNPYIVGSAAYNMAHGLPQTEGNYLDRIATRQAATQATNQGGAQVDSASGPAAAPVVTAAPPLTLSWGTVAVAVAVLWFAVK